MDIPVRWREIIEKVPQKCGVYIFKNSNRYIYIGKAKNLKKRLLQHLRAISTDPKEREIFKQSTSLSWILTENEYEALLLERQLINLHKPKFNIVFKYGGGYPMLVITNEEFPTVKIVRDFEIEGEYFGPFFSVNQAKRTKRLIHQLFKLRTCDPMPKPGKLCMDYHLGLCSAPCVKGKISKDDYLTSVEAAKAFLSGEVGKVLPLLYEKLEYYKQRLEFEKCALLKEQITALENLAAGQNVTNYSFREADIWVFLEGKIYLFLVRGKKFVGNKEFSLPPDKLGKFEDWLLGYYSVNYIPEKVFYYPPSAVENKENIEKYLSQRRGKNVILQGVIPSEIQPLVELNIKKPYGEENVKTTFERVLKIPYPKRIEGFDISHFLGEFIVGSCVVWEKGSMNKKCYRRYRVKTVEGIDDYQALFEVLSRRAKRIKEGKYPVPDIWLIDGGKGQLNVALKVKEKFKLPTFVVALAKRNEILFTEDGRQIPLKEYPSIYQIFGLIRDEAHRVAVNYNRRLREKKILKTLPQRERKIIERNFSGIYEVLNSPDERLKRLGLEPSLKQEIKRLYGEKD